VCRAQLPLIHDSDREIWGILSKTNVVALYNSIPTIRRPTRVPIKRTILNPRVDTPAGCREGPRLPGDLELVSVDVGGDVDLGLAAEAATVDGDHALVP